MIFKYTFKDCKVEVSKTFPPNNLCVAYSV